MSHENLVVLTGEFRVVKSGFTLNEGREIIEVEATVRTGPESQGGMHRVILLSETARKANAFIEANGGDGMLVTVLGLLYSGNEYSRVYVDRISFHLPEHIAKKGQDLFMGAPRSQRGTGLMA
jgi:hypothetical protein